MSFENSSVETEDQPPHPVRRLEVVTEKILPDRKPRSSAGTAANRGILLENAAAAPLLQAAPTPPTAEQTAPSPQMQAALKSAQVAAMFEVVSRILAVRIFLLAAVAGGFALAWRVSDQWSAVVFMVFTICVVLPMILLEYRVRK